VIPLSSLNVSQSSFFASIQDDMDRMEQVLEATLNTDYDFLSHLNRHILSNPGKRLRPSLLFAAGKMLDCPSELLVTYATIYELIHTATLVHDDLIDAAEQRRGKATINADFGATTTVLYGDLLFAKANQLAVTTGRLDVLDVIAEVTCFMVEGELLQVRSVYDLNISEADYFDILERKTACLFGATLKTAGLAANCSEEELQVLHNYGYNLGISFQLIDDYLDFAGDAEVLGKPVLHDLQAGKLTLPVIRFLDRNRKLGESLITRIWESQDHDAVEELLDHLKSDHGLKETYDLGKTYAESATDLMQRFPLSPYRDALAQVPGLMLDRQK